MCKCINCKYMLKWDKLFKYVVCGIDNDVIDEAVANDDNQDCDLYVAELDADDSKA